MYSLIIVDDEDFPRIATKRYIEKMHPQCYVPKTFSNGKDAWDYINATGVDILITDIRMPIMDGLELARLVYEKSPNTAIIIISCHSEFEYAKQAIRYRSVEYLLKPLDLHELSLCLNQITQLKGSQHSSTFNLAPSQPHPKDDEDLEQSTKHKVSLERAIKYINTHYAEQLTREDIAGQLYLSPSYFSRVFKQHTGMSFSDYLRTIRMQKASEMLSNNCKIKDIAKQVGYQSINRFLINFQNHFGCTPSEYRLKNRIKSLEDKNN